MGSGRAARVFRATTVPESVEVWMASIASRTWVASWALAAAELHRERPRDSARRDTGMSVRLGVGILGVGPVTQAIHPPTWPRCTTGSASYTSWTSTKPWRRQSPPAPERARPPTRTCCWTTQPSTSWPICIPHQFHADQVDARVNAGKRAVLCEKPLATSVAEAQPSPMCQPALGCRCWSALYTPTTRPWSRRSTPGGNLPTKTTLVRVTVYLPSNEEMVVSALAQP
jgi:myo-inositol 2-dehydrogenase / D-chiro-inositol 1-dehydrogenase